jgi:hypothetical protein
MKRPKHDDDDTEERPEHYDEEKRPKHYDEEKRPKHYDDEEERPKHDDDKEMRRPGKHRKEDEEDRWINSVVLELRKSK